MQFINFAIVPQLTKLNIDIAPLNLLGLFKGPYDDFNEEWYHDVGSVMCQTMLIQTFSPQLIKIIKYFKKLFMRYYDRGFTSKIEG